MRLYRVAQLAHAMDLSGEGARRYGGRWTPAGLPAVYASEHPALCAFELLVHNGIRIASRPLGFRLVGIDLPDRTRIERVTWMPDDPMQVAEQWLRSQHSALLQVPSVVMPHSWNFIVNPQHPEAAEAQAVDLGLVPFDPRIVNLRSIDVEQQPRAKSFACVFVRFSPFTSNWLSEKFAAGAPLLLPPNH